MTHLERAIQESKEREKKAMLGLKHQGPKEWFVDSFQEMYRWEPKWREMVEMAMATLSNIQTCSGSLCIKNSCDCDGMKANSTLAELERLAKGRVRGMNILLKALTVFMAFPFLVFGIVISFFWELCSTD